MIVAGHCGSIKGFYDTTIQYVWNCPDTMTRDQEKALVEIRRDKEDSDFITFVTYRYYAGIFNCSFNLGCRVRFLATFLSPCGICKKWRLQVRRLTRVWLGCILGTMVASCDPASKTVKTGYPKESTAPEQAIETTIDFNCRRVRSLRDVYAEKGYKDLMPYPMGISSPVMQDFLYNEELYLGPDVWSSGNWVPGILFFRRLFGPNSWLAEASIIVPSSVDDTICEEDPFHDIGEGGSMLSGQFSSYISFMEDKKYGVVFDWSQSQPCAQAPNYSYDQYDIFCRAFFPEKFTDPGNYQIAPTAETYDDTRLRTFAENCVSSHPDSTLLWNGQKEVPTWEAVCAQFERPGTAVTESLLLTSPSYLTEKRQKTCLTVVGWLDNFRYYKDTGEVTDYVWRTKFQYIETVPSHTGKLVARDRPSGIPLILDKAAAVSATNLTSVRDNIRSSTKTSCADLWGDRDYCHVNEGVTTPVRWPIDACKLPWTATMMNPTSATYETVTAQMWVLPAQ